MQRYRFFVGDCIRRFFSRYRYDFFCAHIRKYRKKSLPCAAGAEYQRFFAFHLYVCAFDQAFRAVIIGIIAVKFLFTMRFTAPIFFASGEIPLKKGNTACL